MDELEGTRAQKWEVIEQALQFSSNEQRDRKKGQTSLFDLLGEDDEDSEYYPPLPAIEPWSYLHQLEMEKNVLGFYMSGHPLFEYKSLIKHLGNANSQSGKTKNPPELLITGIVSGITKKKDSKKNPMAFVECEDLSGKFEIPLFNRDYDQYLPLLEEGKVYFISGVRSNFNGSEDGMLRVIPQMIIPFTNISSTLKGDVLVTLSFDQVKKGILNELGSKAMQSPGNFKLLAQVEMENNDCFWLETQKTFFPNDAMLSWLEKEKAPVQVKVVINGKNT